MKILVITPTPTHPPTQGNRVRVAQLAGAFKNHGAIVELLYYAIDGSDPHAVDDMRAAWHNLYTVQPGGFRPRRTHPAHWGVDDWISPNLIEAARALADATQYDAVLVNYVWLSKLLDIFPTQTRRILDTHDAFGDRHQRAREAGLDPHWFYTSVEQEAKGLNRADLVLAIQPEEARYFAGITASRVETLEYAAPPNFLPMRTAGPIRAGYLGSGNPWNVRSITQFDAALAARLAHLPPLNRPTLQLFGGITAATPPLINFRNMGMVEAVQDAYATLDLVVNPMRGGTGLKVKTVESLSYGRPVLSTQSGGAGLESVHPDLLHPTLDALIDRLLGLWDDIGAVGVLAEEMRAGYLGFYAQVVEKLAEILPASPNHLP